MKQKFSVLDVAAVTNELRVILKNKYIVNFYSHKQRLFYFKFSSKDILAIEPGVRLNLTLDHESEINHFCKKLREICRNLRVVDIYQLGFDRIVMIDLYRYRIVLEFYSLGNIIILDRNDMIVEIQRPIEQLSMVKGQKYVWNNVRLVFSPDDFVSIETFCKNVPFENEFGKKMINEYMRTHGIKFENMSDAMRIKEFEEYVRSQICELKWYGEIVFKKGKKSEFKCFDIETSPDLSEVKNIQNKYETNTNVKFPLIDNSELPVETGKSMRFNSFNQTVFSFFRVEKVAKTKIISKEERIQESQRKYINELEEKTCTMEKTACLLEEEREFVSQILSIFQKVYEEKLDWSGFAEFYKTEKERGNPYAVGIKGYDLKSGEAIIKLGDENIKLDLRKTIDQNIEDIYKTRKRMREKAEKTKIAMRDIQAKLKPRKEHIKVQDRVSYWFEKFHFFISENNCVIIGGKNAQQNDQIVNKYMEDRDLYFHCDVKGASSVVCKGSADRNIEDATYFALVYSKAWDEQVIKDVFYVSSDQVSKTAPSGEFLAKGSFMIKGKKNMVYPYRLEYGVGVVFRINNKDNEWEFRDNPDCDDEILHAMAIAGPWVSLKKYRYAVRIVPGNEKKQQVAQTILDRFDKQSTENPRHNMWIRAVRIQELIDVLPGKCKIPKK